MARCDAWTQPHCAAGASGSPARSRSSRSAPRTSVFKVAGKIFAISALERTPLEVSLKCEPELAVALRASYPAIRPGYHLNKRHWNTIMLDGSCPTSSCAT